jgi:hypothetical protein
MMMMRHGRVTLAAIAVALTAAGAAGAQDTGFGGGPPETRYFRIESEVTAGRRGPEVEGHVYNLYDVGAMRVRLRVEAFDGAGRPLETRLLYVPLDVPPRGRAYFRASLPPGAAAVRVGVLNFDWVPRGGGGM